MIFEFVGKEKVTFQGNENYTLYPLLVMADGISKKPYYKKKTYDGQSYTKVGLKCSKELFEKIQIPCKIDSSKFLFDSFGAVVGFSKI